MNLDLSLMKFDVWKQPGRWGERLSVRKVLLRELAALEVGQAQTFEGARTMTGDRVDLSVLRSYVYGKGAPAGKLFQTSLPQGGPLTITRIA